MFAVTRDQAGAAHIESHPVRSQGLEADINKFRTQLANRDLNYRESARALYARLLGPAAAALRNKKRLVIVPDGPLWELPFQALVSSGWEASDLGRDRFLRAIAGGGSRDEVAAARPGGRLADAAGHWGRHQIGGIARRCFRRRAGNYAKWERSMARERRKF